MSTTSIFNDENVLREYGFRGFLTVDNLMTKGCSRLPPEAGVYMMLNSGREKAFLDESVGGAHHKTGESATVPVSELEKKWVDNTIVVYIGQTNSIRARTETRLKFANGKPVRAWGGRYMWQLKNHRELKICYLKCSEQASATLERKLIGLFQAQYGGCKPFANIQ